jgi:hypothetical protein
MKLRMTIGPAAAVLMIVLVANPAALAQVDWTWEEMVVPPGPPGSWDSYGHHVENMVFDGTTYHLFLGGGQGPFSWDTPWAIGHWTWNALTQVWDEDPDNPVLRPDPGEWDAFTIHSAAVLFDNGIYKMWYGATDAPVGESSVGYAESVDGSLWIKHAGNPLPSLAPGPPGTFDDFGSNPGSVLFDGATYRMWCTVIETNGPAADSWRIGYATSPDGITWTKHPEPVVQITQPPWEEDLLFTPEVVEIPGGYAMWYSSWERSPAILVRIGYAVSTDGVHWGKWSDNPVLEPQSGCNDVNSFAAFIDGGTVYGWIANCHDVWYVSSPMEAVFFDAFETGDVSIWSSTVP